MALLAWRRQRPQKSRSEIKWHRLAHFNQTRDWIGWYHAVSHWVASPNPYFTTLGYLCRRVLCGFVTRFSFHSSPDMLSTSNSTRCLWILSGCLTDTLTALCRTTLTFFSPSPALLPVLQLTLSQRSSLTHRGSCWPPGIKEAEWLSSRGSRR